MLQVIVILDALLLNILTISPCENVLFGTVIVPDATTVFPTSAVVSVVLLDDGTFCTPREPV
jgi:hypothetical protein